MFLRSALLVAGAGLAVAQSLSSNCSSTLVAVATSPETTCLDLLLLSPLLASNASASSIIPTVNNWLSGLCSQGPCSNATLQAVVANVTSGCSSDLASYGVPDINNATVVEVTYPTFREIVCLKDTSANSLCVTELLTDIQSTTGTLTVGNVVNLITQITAGSTTLTLPQNVTCSNCSQAAYTIAAQKYPALQSGQSAVQGYCGSSFTDGQIPSNIQETASNSSSSSSSSSSSTSGAVSLSVSGLNIGLIMLIAVGSTFATFV